MNKQKIFKKCLYAGAMGLLTILLCLIVSDDLLGLNSRPARSQVGHYVFWVSLIGLPLLFCKFVSWRYTLLNIPLYFLLYFPVYELCGLKHTHLFLQTGEFISFPVWLGALLVTACFWGIQSLVYLMCNTVFRLLKKQQFGKLTDKNQWGDPIRLPMQGGRRVSNWLFQISTFPMISAVAKSSLTHF